MCSDPPAPDALRRRLGFGQAGLVGDVIAGMHSGADVIRWEGRTDVIVYGAGQLGARMWYLREDGRWRGERVFVASPLAEVQGYPKVFDWNGDGVPDLVTVHGELHLWLNIGGSPLPRFQHAGILYIDQATRRRLPGSITQIEFVRTKDGWAALVGCDDWSQYWPDSGSLADNREHECIGLGKSYDAHGNWQGGSLYGTVWMLDLDSSRSGLALANPRPLRDVGGEPVGVLGTAAPALLDLDGDGLWDLIVGDFGDTLTYCRNVADAEPREFVPGSELRTPNGVLKLHHNLSRPRAVDWRGVGAVDLLVGQENGRVYLTRCLDRRDQGVPVYSEPIALQQRDPELSVGSAAVPVLCDWDGDGDLDLIVGDAGGDVQLFENVGTPNDPRFALPVKLCAEGKPIRIQAGPTGSIQGPAEAKYGYTCPCVADWSGNGLPDLILSDVTGGHTLFINVGTRSRPELAAGQPILCGGKPLQTVWRVRPWAVDWDGDGVVDYLTLDDRGLLTLYKRAPAAGLTEVERWLTLQYEDGTPIKLDGPARDEGRAKLHVVDYNGNGVWDILFGLKGGQPLANGSNHAHLFLLENAGTNARPRFRQPQVLCDDADRPLSFGGHSATPNIAPLFGTERPVLLVGAEDGRIYWFYQDQLQQRWRPWSAVSPDA